MSETDESDEALATRAGRGDRAAAAALISRHTDKIFAACCRMLRDEAASEDAVQETFLRLWRHVGRWRSQGARFDTWLYRIAMNICLDKLRKRKREAPEEAAPTMIDGGKRPDQALFDKDRSRIVWAALGALPVRQRMAITLCHYQELSNIDAAVVMGVSVEAVESLLARGRRTLRAALAPQRANLMGELADEHSIIAS